MLGTRPRPRQGRHRHLRRRRDRRPPVQVGVLLPDHPAARRRHEVRALHQRPHRRDGQPARQPEGELPDGARATRPTPRQWLDGGVEGQGQLVGRLRRRGWTSAPGRSATSRAGSAPPPTSRSATPRAPMSMTAEPTGRGVPRPVRTVAVRGLQARVSVRPARGPLADEPPLLLCNGIGASLEALQPLVDALDPDRGVVRFDVPGVGGSPLPPFPYPIAALSSWVTAPDGARLGSPRVRRARALLGRRAGAAARASSPAGASAAWCWSPPAPASLMVPARPRVLAKMLTPRRHRDPAYAARIAAEIYGGTHARRPRASAPSCCTRRPAPARSAATTTSSPR